MSFPSRSRGASDKRRGCPCHPSRCRSVLMVRMSLTGSGLFTQIFVPQNRAVKTVHLTHGCGGEGGQECASSWRRMSAASAVGTNQRMRRSTGCGCLWYLAIWGPPASLGLRWRHGGFLRSAGELHMAEIKGVAGCTVLLYFQALLLIRKQDQRQY